MANTRRMLVTAVETLDEEKVVSLVKMGLNNGISPLDLIEDVHQGMKRVGMHYEREDYYIADLIMASLIFQRVLTLIPITKENGSEQKPQVIIGTVKHDIHDIGKNIIIGLLRSRGIGVIDLGVDVPPDVFVDAVQETGAKILGLSGLLTSSYEVMREITDTLNKRNLRSRVQVVIGGLVNEDVKEYVGADYWVDDCAYGVEVCRHILNIDVNSSSKTVVGVV
ncbi:MAG: cobalamin-dependent protein [Thermacetogeniaceae bacterium]|nr:cobalamin-binding protein [Syntrophomonadaceae bacterium]